MPIYRYFEIFLQGDGEQEKNHSSLYVKTADILPADWKLTVLNGALQAGLITLSESQDILDGFGAVVECDAGKLTENVPHVEKV